MTMSLSSIYTKGLTSTLLPDYEQMPTHVTSEILVGTYVPTGDTM